jgi:hypothetical protein
MCGTNDYYDDDGKLKLKRKRFFFVSQPMVNIDWFSITIRNRIPSQNRLQSDRK